MIPRINLQSLIANDPEALSDLARAAQDVGFATIYNTPLTRRDVEAVIAAYRAFFLLPDAQKDAVNMARTGGNRGWGAPGAEQVDPNANPDYKQVFDVGFELPANDPLAHEDLACYAPNLWPDAPEGFAKAILAYRDGAMGVAHQVLRSLASAIGEDPAYFEDKFDRPMALLRGNYYPERPAWAGARDFGIAPHTDYGCLTLLATDGVPGLEVQARDGAWVPVVAQPGEFVINFGEMFEMWSQGRVKATLHRVIGSPDERISVPLFFNPNHDTNVAPPGSGQTVRAIDHLEKRFQDTYVHLQDKAS